MITCKLCGLEILLLCIIMSLFITYSVKYHQESPLWIVQSDTQSQDCVATLQERTFQEISSIAVRPLWDLFARVLHIIEPVHSIPICQGYYDNLGIISRTKGFSRSYVKASLTYRDTARVVCSLKYMDGLYITMCSLMSMYNVWHSLDVLDIPQFNHENLPVWVWLLSTH